MRATCERKGESVDVTRARLRSRRVAHLCCRCWYTTEVDEHCRKERGQRIAEALKAEKLTEPKHPVLLVDEIGVIGEALHEEEPNDGKDDNLADGKRDDGCQRELCEGARDAHPGEGRTEDEESEGDRGGSQEVCRIEDDCQRRVSVRCSRVEGGALNDGE